MCDTYEYDDGRCDTCGARLVMCPRCEYPVCAAEPDHRNHFKRDENGVLINKELYI